MTKRATRKAWNNAVPEKASLRELKLEAIYETAARIFHEKGFHGTSLGDIAAALGVTKPALYYYVDSKQDLLYRLHHISLGYAEKTLRHAKDYSKSGLDRLSLSLTEYLIDLARSPTACLVLFEEGALSPEQAAEIMARREVLEHSLRQLVQDGIADGSIAPCNPKMAVFVMLGAINWFSRWYRPGGAWSAEEVAEAMTRQMLRGLAADPMRMTLPTLAHDAPRRTA